jgi:tetraacyldisaccharide 4'-kinase
MVAGLLVLRRAWYLDAWWLHLLRPLEWMYRAAGALRRVCYRIGLFATYRPEKPLVVVGNIDVGGTGKTPVVIALVEALHRCGIRVGVVCRGYGAGRGLFPHIVRADSTPEQCGDEALLIYSRTQCPCVAAPSRVVAVQTLLRDFAVDVVISDDGLQHYALERDIEIIVYDALSGFGNGRCLPAGPLREPVRRLESADFVLARHGSGVGNRVSYRVDGLVNVLSAQLRDVSPLGLGRDVHAIAGVGQPEQFFDALRALDFTPQTRIFPDHHRYSTTDLSALTGMPILMTEKDAVKCRALVGDNAWYLKVSADLPKSVIAAVVSLVTR